jgi:hypothetical protein
MRGAVAILGPLGDRFRQDRGVVEAPLAAPDPQLTGARPVWLLALTLAMLGLVQVRAMSGRIAVGKSEVLYGRGGTRAEARTIADMLVAIGFVNPASDYEYDRSLRLEVTREAGRRVVHLTPLDAPDERQSEPGFAYLDWRERSCLTAMRLLSREAFAGDPLDVRCHDRTGAVEAAVAWEQRTRRLSLDLGDFFRVEYELGGQESEARSIAQSLHELAMSEPARPSHLTVKRSGPTHVVQLTVDVTLMPREHSEAVARELRTRLHPLLGAWSAAVFGGEPVDVWLVYQDDNHLGIEGYEVLSWATRPR